MLSYKKSSFWVIAGLIIIVIIVGIALAANTEQENTIQIKDNAAESPSGTMETAYYSEYNRAKIEYLSDMMGFKSANEFETAYSPIVAYIDSTLRTSLTPVQVDDLNNNNIDHQPGGM
jgi:ABC-type antimicrobial peptide transport system permease subunit